MYMYMHACKPKVVIFHLAVMVQRLQIPHLFYFPWLNSRVINKANQKVRTAEMKMMQTTAKRREMMMEKKRIQTS